MGVKASFNTVDQVNNVLLSHEKCQRKINERISYLWSSQCLQEFCGVHAWKWNYLSAPGTSVQPFGIRSRQNPERHSQKEFFHFFDWGAWVFLQISHLLSAAERFLLELDTTYPSKDERSISLSTTQITLRKGQINWIKARDPYGLGLVVKGEDLKVDLFSAS